MKKLRKNDFDRLLVALRLLTVGAKMPEDWVVLFKKEAKQMNLTVSELLRILVSDFLFNRNPCFASIGLPEVHNYENKNQLNNDLLSIFKESRVRKTNENNKHIIQEQEPFSTSHVKNDGTIYYKDLLPANNKNGISKKDAEGFGSFVGATLILLSILGKK